MHKKRPILSNIVNAKTTEIESFQNAVIRPIIKMQHQLIITFFESYLKKRKIVFTSLSEVKRNNTIKSALEKDIAFKNKIIGSILGHFSIDEFQNYNKKASEYNRRIKQIIIKRLQDSLTSIT